MCSSVTFTHSGSSDVIPSSVAAALTCAVIAVIVTGVALNKRRKRNAVGVHTSATRREYSKYNPLLLLIPTGVLILGWYTCKKLHNPQETREGDKKRSVPAAKSRPVGWDAIRRG